MSSNEFIDKDILAEQKSREETRKEKRSSRRKKRTNANDDDSKRVLVQIMNGEFLSRDNFIGNLPFTFFIGFLLVIMIGWGYYAETVTKHEVQLEKELGELNSEFFTLGSEYNSKRGRRPIAEKLLGTGVKESLSSPRKIRVRKYQFE
jgi:hypothetical protein